MEKIFPCLWFSSQAQEAARFYCGVFGDAEIVQENEFVSIFRASGQSFMCLNGCQHIKPNPSVSFFVLYENKEELEKAYRRLEAEGQVLMPLDSYEWSEKYGWVQDRFGISWQLCHGKFADVGQKFTPLLMYTGINTGKASAAIEYYTSVFRNASIEGILNYSANDKDSTELVKHAQFKLEGQVFMAMDSSMDHAFNFNDALSLVINCESQQEIDYYWEQLSKDGREGPCGWLLDRFGLSWQVVPSVLGQLMSDPARAPRVREAFMKMKKFDIEELMNA